MIYFNKKYVIQAPRRKKLKIIIFDVDKEECEKKKVLFGDWVSLMLLVNSHKLKMTAASTPGREYNRRAAIIEGFRTRRLPTKIIRFFEYPRSIIYNVVAKYSASEQSNEFNTPARKSHSKERTARTPAMIERTRALISENPVQLLRKLASIVV